MNRKLNLMYWCFFLGGLFFFQACYERRFEMSNEMMGIWCSSDGRPGLVLGVDTTSYFAIVNHQIIHGRICPIRYPVFLSSPCRGYIQAEGRINFYYNASKRSLILSPGGTYYRRAVVDGDECILFKNKNNNSHEKGN